MRPIRVVLADDNLLIRQGLSAVITTLVEIDLVGDCADVDELHEAVAELAPDVVITDIRMPPTHTDEGIRAALRIRTEYPETGVVVLSQYAEPEYVLMLFDNGSERLGYLLKDRVGPADLERAIRSVATGGSAVDARIVDLLVSSRSRRPSPIDRLTRREREVLAAIAAGDNNAAIAERLVVSHRAVARHINSIFAKLGLGEDDATHHRVKAVLLWLSETS